MSLTELWLNFYCKSERQATFLEYSVFGHDVFLFTCRWHAENWGSVVVIIEVQHTMGKVKEFKLHAVVTSMNNLNK